MATNKIQVGFTGPTLSLLLLESARNHGNGQGLLYGSLNVQTENQVTDHCDVETTSHHISVNNYSNLRIRELCASNNVDKNLFENCVGFFSHRKNISRLSLFENLLHKRIQKWTSFEDCIILLISCDHFEDDHRYRWNIATYNFKETMLCPVRMNIRNLGDCKNGSYKTTSYDGHSAKVKKIFRNLPTSECEPKTPTFVSGTKKVTSKLVEELDMNLSQLQSTQCAINMARLQNEQLKAELNSEKYNIDLNEEKYSVENQMNNTEDYSSNLQSSIQHQQGIIDEKVIHTIHETNEVTAFSIDIYNKSPHQALENDETAVSLDTKKQQLACMSTEQNLDEFASLVETAKRDIKNSQLNE